MPTPLDAHILTTGTLPYSPLNPAGASTCAAQCLAAEAPRGAEGPQYVVLPCWRPARVRCVKAGPMAICVGVWFMQMVLEDLHLPWPLDGFRHSLLTMVSLPRRFWRCTFNCTQSRSITAQPPPQARGAALGRMSEGTRLVRGAPFESVNCGGAGRLSANGARYPSSGRNA